MTENERLIDDEMMSELFSPEETVAQEQVAIEGEETASPYTYGEQGQVIDTATGQVLGYAEGSDPLIAPLREALASLGARSAA